MNDEFEKYYNSERDIWGEPQEYKGVKFYPILLRDVYLQSLFRKYLCFPKNYIKNEIDIIKASYIHYILVYVCAIDKEDYVSFKSGLEEFLSKITRQKVIIKDTKIEHLDVFVYQIKIGNTTFDEQEFDIIRSIILKQNGLSYNHIEDFDPDLEPALRHYERESEDITLNDQVFTLSSLSGKLVTEDSMKNLTLYQFKQSFSRLVLKFDYEILYPLEVSGQIKSKNGKKISKNYLSHVEEKGRYDSILIKKEEFIKTNPLMKDNNK